MTMAEMLKDLVENGLILPTGQYTLPNYPDNYFYVQTTTSYGVNLTLDSDVGTKKCRTGTTFLRK